jgi:ABC-type transporter lipoprotein component MlaA
VLCLARRHRLPEHYAIAALASNFFENISDVWSMVNNALQAAAEVVDSFFSRHDHNTFWAWRC